MIDVGACAYVYLSSAPMSGVSVKLSKWMGCSVSEAIYFASYLTSLHDLGKASPYFVQSSKEQYESIPLDVKAKYFPRPGGLRFRHERESAAVACRIWMEKGEFDNRTRATFAAILGLHHQGKREDPGLEKAKPEWQDAQGRLETKMRTLFCPHLPQLHVVHQDALGCYLVGLVVLCDWVASSTEFDAMLEIDDDTAYLRVAKERAAVTLRAFGLLGDTPFPRVEGFSALWPKIRAHDMRPVQIACTDAARWYARLTIIEAPMGEGKTEAALYMATQYCNTMHLQGIYMAMPTAATSNQMHERFRAMLQGLDGTHSVRLLHSLAWLLDEMSPESGSFHLDTEKDGDAQNAVQWLAPLRRGMLSENAVGTVDQAMAAVVYRKYGLLRLTGLTGKVLVIDEIHAYDVYMGEIIQRLLEWCDALCIPVILLSATMQRAQKIRYLKCYGILEDAPLSDAYPLVTQVDEHSRLVETHVDGVAMKSRFLLRTLPIMDDVDEIGRRAIERVANGGCLCLMLNTVRKAQAVYQAIRSIAPEGLYLFHARFINGRRNEIERECIKLFGKEAGASRPGRAILVCTQVVEQSLDVDFDGMMTELAPIDLLIQRAGRVHRHRERQRPSGFEEPLIEVLVPDAQASSSINRYGGTGVVYDPYILTNTEALLSGISSIQVPEDVRVYIERVYTGLSPEKIETYIKMQTREEIMKISADATIFPTPNAQRFFGANGSITERFEHPDEDAGLRIAKGASTRYGDDSVRVAFLDEELFTLAAHEPIKRQDEINIFKNMCSLSLTTIANEGKLLDKDVCKRYEIYLMTSGHLSGCYAVKMMDGIARIGDRVLHVDDELGVWVEE